MALLAGLTKTASRTWVFAALPLAMCGCAAMNGCDDATAAKNVKVKISGQSFYLEAAMDNAKRFHGLSERTSIEPNGGMLFVFPEVRDPSGGGFVMRDCPIDIDILYLDKSAHVLTTYTMTPQPPRGADEGKAGSTSGDPTPENAKYEQRLKQYVSHYPYAFVIELKGGRIKEIGVKEGDVVEFDHKELMQQAK